MCSVEFKVEVHLNTRGAAKLKVVCNDFADDGGGAAWVAL
jgi:hypothetical protein